MVNAWRGDSRNPPTQADPGSSLPSVMLKQAVRAFVMTVPAAVATGFLAGCIPSMAGGPVEGAEGFTYTAPLAGGESTVQAYRSGDSGGPRVIFVHGTPGSARDWRGFMAAPPAGMEAVAVDRPGFGGSGPRRAVTSLAEHARALEPLLVERGGVKPILVGWSYGGPVVVKAAIEYPERVGGIVIVAGALDPGLERVFWYQRVGEALPFLLPRWLRNANDELIPLEAELRGLEAELPRLAVPVEIVHGTRDGLVVFANVPYMQRMFPEPPGVTAVEGAGHGVVWSHPGAVLDAIERLRGGRVPVDSARDNGGTQP